MSIRDCSVLIVEDDRSVRQSLLIVLSATGYQVRTAEDGFSALKEMKSKVPDILLSDLNMPGMSGFELLSVVRRRFPSVQVMAMSGTIADILGGLAADAFYEKGGGVASLLVKLEKLACSGGPERRLGADSLPQWIQASSENRNGRTVVTLSCPECLRTFPQLFEDREPMVRDAECEHCGSMVAYAVVQRDPGEIFPYSRLTLVSASERSTGPCPDLGSM